MSVVRKGSRHKSTLVNSLLARRLILCNKENCRAPITEVRATNKNKLAAIAYNMQGEIVWDITELTDEAVYKLNSDKNVYRIVMDVNIPFFDLPHISMRFIIASYMDAYPCMEYRNMAYQTINNDFSSLILYVLNGTQLGMVDDKILLNYVSEQMKKGGKQVRDRFLFVINKMEDLTQRRKA